MRWLSIFNFYLVLPLFSITKIPAALSLKSINLMLIMFA